MVEKYQHLENLPILNILSPELCPRTHSQAINAFPEVCRFNRQQNFHMGRDLDHALLLQNDSAKT